MTDISSNLKTIQSNITSIAQEWKRDPKDINLIAVSKVQPPEKIQAALNTGHRLFGENRVQEAQQHWAQHREAFPDLNLHLIGPLQTNKVKDAIALFDVIETLDREKLARALAKEMQNTGRHLPCFIQVNTGEEQQKAGIAPKDIQSFHEFCTKECGLNIIGLMCIPPIHEPAAMHFGLLHKIAQSLDLPHLSMGMSADYEQAIPLGATYIRIGTGIFGERDYR